MTVVTLSDTFNNHGTIEHYALSNAPNSSAIPTERDGFVRALFDAP